MSRRLETAAGGAAAGEQAEDEEPQVSRQWARCNCAGNKRASLNGLVELFEQRLQVSPGECGMRDAEEDGGEQDADFSDHQSTLRRVARKGWQVLPTGGRQPLRPTPATTSSPPTSRPSSDRCPSLVRHQPSSSRRLLNQLARLRRLSEPHYRIRRPEKAAQVERLIEQLERATADWAEDEQLLERAERRDLPARYQGGHALPDDGEAWPRRAHESDGFGIRHDVSPQEEAAIASSHSSVLSLGRQRRRPRALPDRYHDDQARRRLLGSPSTAVEQQHSPPEQQEATSKRREMHRQSYLLCSGAYTPPMDSPLPADPLERRLLGDDLHFRSVRSKPEPSEPPFGIPRQPLVADTLSKTPLARQRAGEKRSDSRVSFVDSLDSGVARESPLSPAEWARPSSRRSTAAARLAASLPQAGQTEEDSLGEGEEEDDAGEEIELNLELEPELEEPGESPPPVERCRAEYLATPSRRRPQIPIESPQARSPLLRAGGGGQWREPANAPDEPRPETPQARIRTYEEARRLEELECRYQFSDDDDDDGQEEPVLRKTKPPVTTQRSPDSSIEEPSDSYIERLQHRGRDRVEEPPANSTCENTDSQKTQKAPKKALFSIGQYKPIKRPVKIL